MQSATLTALKFSPSLKPPKVFVFSGPGGVGKTTLVKSLFRRKFIKDNFIRGVSFTTRDKRQGEKTGKDYFFISKEEFLKLKKKDFFLETQKVINDYYGTPKSFYLLAMEKKKDLILCIDVKGGIYLKKKSKLGRIVTIFISAPMSQLYLRLKKRIESKSIIREKIKLAKKELQLSKCYDYSIINRDIKNTLKKIEEVFKNEQCRGAPEARTNTCRETSGCR